MPNLIQILDIYNESSAFLLCLVAFYNEQSF